jgi:hypothetical protein
LAIALAEAANGSILSEGRTIQDQTLCEEKLESFFSFFGLDGKQTPEVQSRALLFLDLGTACIITPLRCATYVTIQIKLLRR